MGKKDNSKRGPNYWIVPFYNGPAAVIILYTSVSESGHTPCNYRLLMHAGRQTCRTVLGWAYNPTELAGIDR